MKRNSRNIGMLSIVMLSLVALTGCATNQFVGDPLETVDSLDLDRYLGR